MGLLKLKGKAPPAEVIVSTQSEGRLLWTYSRGKGVRPISKNPGSQDWLVTEQILHIGNHPRGAEKHCNSRWSTLVSPIEGLFGTAERTYVCLSMQLQEHYESRTLVPRHHRNKGHVLASIAVESDARCITICLSLRSLFLRVEGIENSRIRLSRAKTVS